MLTNEQIVARRGGIGGSDVAAILGLSPWRTPLDVWMEKLGRADPAEESAPMRWGSLLEPVIVAEFERQTGIAVARGLPTMSHATHEWMLANLDGRADDGAVVEAKTARTDHDWGEPGSSEIPDYYHTQVAHYLAVTGARLAYVPVLIGASDFRVYTIARDESFVADLIEAERAFWFDHVLARVAPEPVNREDAAKLWTRDNGKTIEVEVEVASQVAELRDLRAQIKALKERDDAIVDALAVAFADAATIAYAGVELATYKHQKRKGYTVAETEFRALRLK